MSHLHMIPGGRLPKEQCPRRFVTALCTDTRLMGVLGLHIHWQIIGASDAGDLHQFFYLDCEEYGIESYTALWSDNPEEIESQKHILMDCLGGREVCLSLEQASVLLAACARFNQAQGEPLPGACEQYRELIREAPRLTLSQRQALWNRICEPLVCHEQVLHYFLMRCFARDFEAAGFLADAEVLLDLYSDLPPATLCRNTISPKETSYLCESLLEIDGQYQIAVSELTLRDLQVTGYARRSGFSITPQEAAMQLTRTEFITLYDLTEDADSLSTESLEAEWATMVTPHPNGRLFLIFHEDNAHVRREEYRLGDDVFGLYYLTDYGQLLVVAYDLFAIQKLEQRLSRSSLRSILVPTAKYEFHEPAFYDFVQGDFPDFEEFVQTIRLDP